jgi:hypothetical protein
MDQRVFIQRYLVTYRKQLTSKTHDSRGLPAGSLLLVGLSFDTRDSQQH